jgi:GntR family transcriptional repressor for pyruvate dehydrogenase complex
MSVAGGQFKQPKVSSMVADLLRQRVLDGEIEDMLPSQDALLAEFSISKPSLREALRILESEGLITVRRGNLGGAFIHRPTARHAAYMMALVLQSRAAPIDDVAAALKHLEGTCVGLCAARPDRLEEVVPHLDQSNDRAQAALDDPLVYVTETADFHRLLVSLCGSESMMLTVGALETIWLAHVQEWAETTAKAGTFPDRDYRKRGLGVHRKLARLIGEGNVNRASRLAEEHFDPTQFYSGTTGASQLVRADVLHKADVSHPSHHRAS